MTGKVDKAAGLYPASEKQTERIKMHEEKIREMQRKNTKLQDQLLEFDHFRDQASQCAALKEKNAKLEIKLNDFGRIQSQLHEVREQRSELQQELRKLENSHRNLQEREKATAAVRAKVGHAEETVFF